MFCLSSVLNQVVIVPKIKNFFSTVESEACYLCRNHNNSSIPYFLWFIVAESDLINFAATTLEVDRVIEFYISLSLPILHCHTSNSDLSKCSQHFQHNFSTTNTVTSKIKSEIKQGKTLRETFNH